MDPKLWKKHAESEGTEYEVAHYTLAGRGFYISYNGNEFIRRMNAKNGLPNVGDCANPETALVVVPSEPVRWINRKLGRYVMRQLTMFLKEKRSSPPWFKAVTWLQEMTKTEFFILRGDHRDAYEKLYKKGLGACHAYFLEQAKIDGRHFYSD